MKPRKNQRRQQNYGAYRRHLFAFGVGISIAAASVLYLRCATETDLLPSHLAALTRAPESNSSLAPSSPVQDPKAFKNARKASKLHDKKPSPASDAQKKAATLKQDLSIETVSKAAAKTPQPSEAAAAKDAALKGGVLLIGDSMMRVGVGPSLKQRLHKKGYHPVDLKAKSSTGLSRPDTYDWPKAAQEFVAPGLYDTVIVHIGTNDCQAITQQGRSLRFATPAWDEAYAGRLTRFAKLLCERVHKVFWIGLPPMREPGFNKRIQHLDEVTRRALADAECVEHVPAPRTIAPDGRFARQAKVGQRQRDIRESDGIHYAAHGGALVADAISDLLPSL